MSRNVRSSYPGHSGYARADDDYYREPRWIVNAMLDVVAFRGTSLDPFCGGGTIPSCFQERGLRAIGSDLVNRGFGKVQDFFERTEKVDNVVSNPPYKLAEPAIRHALTLVRFKIVLLLRLPFLEGACRDDLFATTPLKQVLVSRRRVSCPPGVPDGQRDKWGALIQPEEKGGKMPYAWLVFEIGHRGDATIRRI